MPGSFSPPAKSAGDEVPSPRGPCADELERRLLSSLRAGASSRADKDPSVRIEAEPTLDEGSSPPVAGPTPSTRPAGAPSPFAAPSLDGPSGPDGLWDSDEAFLRAWKGTLPRPANETARERTPPATASASASVSASASTGVGPPAAAAQPPAQVACRPTSSPSPLRRGRSRGGRPDVGSGAFLTTRARPVTPSSPPASPGSPVRTRPGASPSSSPPPGGGRPWPPAGVARTSPRATPPPRSQSARCALFRALRLEERSLRSPSDAASEHPDLRRTAMLRVGSRSMGGPWLGGHRTNAGAGAAAAPQWASPSPAQAFATPFPGARPEPPAQSRPAMGGLARSLRKAAADAGRGRDMDDVQSDPDANQAMQ